MIKDHQRELNRFQVVLDAAVIAVSYGLAWLLMINGFVPTKGDPLRAEFYLMALLIVVPVYLFLYAVFQLYTPKRVQGRRLEFANICKANSIGLLMFTLVLYLISKNPFWYNFSRPMIIYFFVINIVLETAERNAIRAFLRSMRAKGYNLKHILLVGYSRAAEGYIDRVKQNPEWGYHIAGILDDHKALGEDYKGIRVLGTIGELNSILDMNVLDEIAITLSIKEFGNLGEIVAACEKSGVHTKFIPDYNNIIPTRPYMEDLLGLPVIHIRHVPLTNGLNKFMKRTVDIFGAIVAIILFSPVMLAAAVLVKITSPGPVIYCQERVGLHNRPFKMYKFRSMEVQAPTEEKSKWTTPHDPRVTPVGRFIRKTSIDEMPQFFNVL